MEHIDFHISYRCSNKCLFCSSAEAIAKYKSHPLDLEEILKKLENKRRRGFKSVNFTGGEPTLFSLFPVLVKESKRLGYRIYVGTNGGRFVSKKFCQETAPFIDEVCFSYHGHRPGLHNYLTNNQSSFLRLQKAMDNLAGFPVRFISNTVVTSENFRALEKIMVFLIKKQMKQVLISNLAPEGRGLVNYGRLAVKLNDFKKKIPLLIKMSNERNIVIRFFGLPACILGSFACYSNDFCWDQRLNIEQGKHKEFYLKEEQCCLPTRSRIKTARCNGCHYNEICGGVFKQYYEKFGDEELKPFPR